MTNCQRIEIDEDEDGVLNEKEVIGEPDDIVVDESVGNLMLTMCRTKTRREFEEALNLKLRL